MENYKKIILYDFENYLEMEFPYSYSFLYLTNISSFFPSSLSQYHKTGRNFFISDFIFFIITLYIQSPFQKCFSFKRNFIFILKIHIIFSSNPAF